MPETDLVLRSNRVVLPHDVVAAAVLVADRRVVGIVPRDATTAAVADVDLGDRVLLPGLVDTHVHVNEPGRTDWEGFASATQAAAAGGVTTIVDMPLNSRPTTVNAAALAAKQSSARGKCAVDYGFWGGVVPGNHEALASLIEGGARGFKCFLWGIIYDSADKRLDNRRHYRIILPINKGRNRWHTEHLVRATAKAFR